MYYFITIWILVLSNLRNVVVEPLLSVLIEMLREFLKVPCFHCLVTVGRVGILIAIASATVRHDPTTSRLARVVTVWTLCICCIDVWVLMDGALCHLSLGRLKLFCLQTWRGLRVLNLDWLSCIRVNTFVQSCDDLLSSDHHVFLIDRARVRSYRVEHLRMRWVLNVPKARWI